MLENVDKCDKIEESVGKSGSLQCPDVELHSRNAACPFGGASGKLDAMELIATCLLEVAQQPAVTAADVKDSGAGLQATREMPGAGF